MTFIIPEKEYDELHKQNLVPLDIRIDVESFLDDMQQYQSFFKQWGDKFTDLPRYGLPLVNKNGRLDNDPEPVCWPLDRWNFVNLGYNDTPEDFTKFYKDIQDNINTDKLELEIDRLKQEMKTMAKKVEAEGKHKEKLETEGKENRDEIQALGEIVKETKEILSVKKKE